MRDEGISYLEEIFIHFDVINSPNIGKGYIDRFGDTEVYFGKSDSFSINSESKNISYKPNPCSSLVDHGFQLVLECMLLKGLLLDNLWQMRDVGIRYLRNCSVILMLYIHLTSVKGNVTDLVIPKNILVNQILILVILI